VPRPHHVQAENRHPRARFTGQRHAFLGARGHCPGHADTPCGASTEARPLRSLGAPPRSRLDGRQPMGAAQPRSRGRGTRPGNPLALIPLSTLIAPPRAITVAACLRSTACPESSFWGPIDRGASGRRRSRPARRGAMLPPCCNTGGKEIACPVRTVANERKKACPHNGLAPSDQEAHYFGTLRHPRPQGAVLDSRLMALNRDRRGGVLSC
jgi:hypothetical protein